MLLINKSFKLVFCKSFKILQENDQIFSEVNVTYFLCLVYACNLQSLEALSTRQKNTIISVEVNISTDSSD